MIHATHHQCTAGCEVKVAWEELYMDCPEMFDSTRRSEIWLSCRAGEGRNHKTDVLPKTYVLSIVLTAHPPIGAGLVSIYSRHHTAVQPICTAWEQLYMDCPEMFDSTRRSEIWLSCRAGEGRNHKTIHNIMSHPCVRSAQVTISRSRVRFASSVQRDLARLMLCAIANPHRTVT